MTQLRAAGQRRQGRLLLRPPRADGVVASVLRRRLRDRPQRRRRRSGRRAHARERRHRLRRPRVGQHDGARGRPRPRPQPRAVRRPAGRRPDFPYPRRRHRRRGATTSSRRRSISPDQGQGHHGLLPEQWVSDYTYNALFDRIVGDRASSRTSCTPSTAVQPGAARYRVATVGECGRAHWDGELDSLEGRSLEARHRQAKFFAESGDVVAQRQAKFYSVRSPPRRLRVRAEGRGSRTSQRGSRSRIEGFTSTLAR